jgi:hypothetical protein
MNHAFIISALLVGFAHASNAATPPEPPAIYGLGPTSPQVDNAGLFAPERAAYALLEGAVQEVEAVIAATNCATAAGTYDIYLFSDGSIHNPSANVLIVDSPASTFSLYASIDPNDDFRGQTITVSQSEAGSFKRVALANYLANVAYNAKGTLMTLNSSLKVKGVNGLFNLFQSHVTKNHYAAIDSLDGLPYIFDWGLQSLAKLGYPVQKYWQRSKALRDDSLQGRTRLVKDRLVGPTPCRIVIDTADYNNPDFFYQAGTLSISSSVPGIEADFDF